MTTSSIGFNFMRTQMYLHWYLRVRDRVGVGILVRWIAILQLVLRQLVLLQWTVKVRQKSSTIQQVPSVVAYCEGILASLPPSPPLGITKQRRCQRLCAEDKCVYLLLPDRPSASREDQNRRRGERPAGQDNARELNSDENRTRIGSDETPDLVRAAGK